MNLLDAGWAWAREPQDFVIHTEWTGRAPDYASAFKRARIAMWGGHRGGFWVGPVERTMSVHDGRIVTSETWVPRHVTLTEKDGPPPDFDDLA